MPKAGGHSWIEVQLEGRWSPIDSYINDQAFYERALKRLKASGAAIGYSVSFIDGKFSCEFNFGEKGFVHMGAVLDHFGLEDVTLIGLSMGGDFALRAAALESRVKRVIASGHAFDYRKVARAPAAALLMFFHDHLREFSNRMSLRKIKQGGMEAWNISHLMYVLGLDEPMAALEFAFALNEENLHSDLVRQDVLILASREDHFIPFRLHREQLRRLTGARSVTDRVFTREDQAQNHCQIGNIGLALRVMEEWLDTVARA